MPNKPLMAVDIESLITTKSIIPERQLREAELIAKDDLILSGLEIFKTLFLKLDSGAVFLSEPFKDGDSVAKDSTIIKFRCDGVRLLEGEKVGTQYFAVVKWNCNAHPQVC